MGFTPGLKDTVAGTVTVTGPLTDTELRATPVPVSGAVTASGGFTAITSGRKVVTTAGTRVQLASTTPCKRVTITAETDNTGVVVVGGSGVIASLSTRVGVPLNAGDSYWEDLTDLALVYIDSTINGDGVTFVYTT